MESPGIWNLNSRSGKPWNFWKCVQVIQSWNFRFSYTVDLIQWLISKQTFEMLYRTSTSDQKNLLPSPILFLVSGSYCTFATILQYCMCCNLNPVSYFSFPFGHVLIIQALFVKMWCRKVYDCVLQNILMPHIFMKVPTLWVLHNHLKWVESNEYLTWWCQYWWMNVHYSVCTVLCTV